MNFFHLTGLAAVSFASALTAQSVNLPPAGLAPGDTYRVLLTTPDRSDATSTDIADYNAFVQAQAANNPALAALNTNWTAVCSTATVDARDNTNTNPTPAGPTGLPIYRTDGLRLADDYDHLWSTVSTPLYGTPSGATGGRPFEGCWTGTSIVGIANRELGGTARPWIANHWIADERWITGFTAYPNTTPLRFYAMSDVLTVPMPIVANATAYGVGCAGIAPVTFYQSGFFEPGNSTVEMRWNGTAYDLSGSFQRIVPVVGGTPLTLGNEELQSLTLPFSMPTPTGSTNTVRLSSNGFLAFQTTMNPGAIPSSSALLADEARLAFLWHDLDPSLGGTVYASVDANDPSLFRISFLDVPSAGNMNARNSVQVTLSSNGDVRMAYGQIGAQGLTIGYSTGNGAPDPGSINLAQLRPSACYEENVTDFAFTSFDMVFAGANANYDFRPGTGTYVAPQGAATVFGDDQVQQITLPWNFVNTQGSTNAVWLCSNGHLSFEAEVLGQTFSNFSQFGTLDNRLVFLGTDLDPTSGGSIYTEVDATNADLFHITFVDVPAFRSSDRFTCQLTISRFGVIQVNYEAVATIPVVGFTLGGMSTLNPGSSDLTQDLPLTLGGGTTQSISTTMTMPLQLTSDRPVRGASPTLTVSNIPPSTLFGALIVGGQQFSPGISLSSFGMPGCSRFTDGSLATVPFAINGSVGQSQLAIPAGADGIQLFWQAAVIAPGVNPQGVLASNGMAWTTGVQ